ncbi:hypothetical protein FHP25_20000 [Vineibacter terrae]|uniref:Uncharacterized protein n=1 Tax=Vineibacter terrae TaxID=2586908 RepID=A0A5C8PJJ4_9HYPH|nr:hypothetical protein [Vineibacter terrae]TXL73694.1 hypothetical protein FHP25_20000 [Vineibacter terrae]
MTYVVNMIPNVFSGEMNQDSEPNLAIDPADPARVAGSAFTPDPLGGANAPVFVSVDAGLTWTLNNIVPSTAGAATGDITLAFGHQGRLYSGILRRPGGLRLNILRTTSFTVPTVMDVLVDRTGSGVDQPYVEAARVFRGAGTGQDRVFVGNNDFNGAAGRTATVDVSLDGAAAVPPPPSNFVARRIEPRATGGQDLPPIRPSVHIDGTVYAAYIGRRAGGNSDIVVARDDNWAAGPAQFVNLLDAVDGLAGQRVVTAVNVPFENFQTMALERLVASDLSIAVDPRNSSIVWLAWGDRPPGTVNLTLHVRRSTDRGQTWSADLRTVADAKAPVVAVNSRGRVAFLYQQLVGVAPNQRWVTQVDRSDDAFVTITSTVLATVPANAPARVFFPYLGDYMDMKSPGKDFYGIFSANNTPDLANFPIGVTYLRNANFGTHTLLAADGVTPVGVSIDPFFFCLTEMPSDQDFYVADWTDSATAFDRGVEPSTEPQFYTRSDVWTRLTDAPGAFDGNNRPVNEAPRNGPGAFGDNFAFARIRRRGTGSAQAVTAHFLVSPFGTGSNYVDAGTAPDAVVNFTAADSVLTMAAGYPWHLDAISSSHLCLAVEISTAQDPVVAPGLLGRAPGWPTTDLLVVNDNNKAQRNMGLGPTTASGWFTRYGLIHNGATIRRDIVLEWARLGPSKRGRQDRVMLAGGREQSLGESGRLVVPDMSPGEHRWVRVTLRAGDDAGDTVVVFNEMVGSLAVNGFAVAARLQSEDEVSKYILGRLLSVLTRLEAFGIADAGPVAKRVRSLLDGRISGRAFLEVIAGAADMLLRWLPGLLERVGGKDTLGIAASGRSLAAALSDKDVPLAQSHAGALVESIDSLLTTADKNEGDLADICQNLRWQAALFSGRRLSRLKSANALVRQSVRFVDDFAARAVTASEYPALMKRSLAALKEATVSLKDKQLTALFDALANGLGNARTLQRRHWEFLLALAARV